MNFQANRKIESEAISIIEKLQNAGFIAYFAGGFVRDRLLGIKSSDIDIATNATVKDIDKLFNNCKFVGKSFGVSLIETSEAFVEVATFRVDGPYRDGRHPAWVRQGTEKEDAFRRDFTINSMYLDPITNKLIDYTGGQKDLESKIIKAVGSPESRFEEDYLRMLRCIRFSARLGFKIEKNTWEAICKLAPKAAILAIERVREELTKILQSPYNSNGLRMLSESGLLKIWLPEVENMKGIEQPKKYHPEGDVFEHTMLALDKLDKPSATLAWATLLHDIGKPPTKGINKEGQPTFPLHHREGGRMTKQICQDLKFSNKETELISSLVYNHMRFIDYPKMKQSTRKKFFALDRFDEHLELHRADCLASHGDISNYDEITTLLKNSPEQTKLPPPLINGKELIAIGFKESPELGEILNNIRELQLEGIISSKEEAIEVANKSR